ncbi:MAG: LuxR C-terminal-related transcriptional regulator [Chloroflexota bacterium]
MGGVEAGSAALDLQRGGIAVLDLDGIVTWTDEAWATEDGDDGLPRVPIGANLLQTYRGDSDPRVQAVANAIAAVFEGKATYFEIEHRPTRDSQSSFLTSVAALRGDGAGAVLIHKVVGERGQPNPPRSADVKTIGGPIGDGFDRLTPREREVLDLMAVGLDNRAIAAELGIQYTTVRGHVRSVIEKLGARSRLEAVAWAYQMGLVPT